MTKKEYVEVIGTKAVRDEAIANAENAKVYTLKANGMEAKAEVKRSGKVRVVFGNQTMWCDNEEQFKAQMAGGCEIVSVEEF